MSDPTMQVVCCVCEKDLGRKPCVPEHADKVSGRLVMPYRGYFAGAHERMVAYRKREEAPTIISRCMVCGRDYDRKPCQPEMDGKVSHGLCGAPECRRYLYGAGEPQQPSPEILEREELAQAAKDHAREAVTIMTLRPGWHWMGTPDEAAAHAKIAVTLCRRHQLAGGQPWD